MGGKIGYAALCVVGPMLWGLLIVWASNRIERALLARRSPAPGSDKEETAMPPIDYHI